MTDIAEHAGVTVQTVLRRFGDRDSVFAAAIERFATDVFAQRAQAVADDLDDVVSNLVDHYEQWGRMILKMLAGQSAAPAVRAAVEGGEAYHRDWCARVFAGSLSGLPRAERTRRLAQFVAL